MGTYCEAMILQHRKEHVITSVLESYQQLCRADKDEAVGISHQVVHTRLPFKRVHRYRRSIVLCQMNHRSHRLISTSNDNSTTKQTILLFSNPHQNAEQRKCNSQNNISFQQDMNNMSKETSSQLGSSHFFV